jgi:hypothetical protein
MVLLGYLVFDGNGHIVSSNTATPNGASIPGTGPMVQPLLDFTGTYTVNTDCSGTIMISNSPQTNTSVMTTSGLTLNFVQLGIGNASTQQFQMLDLTVSNSSTIGSGYAIAQ